MCGCLEDSSTTERGRQWGGFARNPLLILVVQFEFEAGKNTCRSLKLRNLTLIGLNSGFEVVFNEIFRFLLFSMTF